MSGWLDIATNEPVAKGQLLGYTGESASGFDHLHFEICDARPEVRSPAGNATRSIR